METCLSADPSASLVLLPHIVALSATLSTLIHASHLLLRAGEHVTPAGDCLASALRTLVDLTSGDSQWSVTLAQTPGAIQALVNIIIESRAVGLSKRKRGEEEEDEVEGQSGFDILCLALGVLTNLVETAEGARDTLREICKLQLSVIIIFPRV